MGNQRSGHESLPVLLKIYRPRDNATTDRARLEEAPQEVKQYSIINLPNQ